MFVLAPRGALADVRLLPDSVADREGRRRSGGSSGNDDLGVYYLGLIEHDVCPKLGLNFGSKIFGPTNFIQSFAQNWSGPTFGLFCPFF